ncbi:(2E,6E)-farnesyl diphosphate synthase [uncultured Thiodictyon sp.]|uniref:(2E,6E)-farnesyl diphosphate synthase n=1 Tax=uncultured Thiodictyon sp. TaxID=1846217 RepID=UPI0025D1A202|nr:farnesyl diphosphate synthase [uncultured Thiodictyon sp.]
MSEQALDAFRARCVARVQATLEQLLPAPGLEPTRLHEAMRYSVLNGGKRIRPLLCYAAGEALGIAPALLDRPAAAVELIHAYSLIHDDLPAMDDDALRRGRPTCHIAFDEATAILAGDSLQTLAFQALAEASELSAGARIAMVETLAQASGSRGMAGGQALDLAAEGKQLDRVMLEHIHIHKTGALIRAAVRLAILADTPLDADHAERLDRYAKCVGLAFQIQDDVLDVVAETTVTGKTRGRDQDLAKSTYPSVVGLVEAKEMAHNLLTDALTAVSVFGVRGDPLRWVVESLIVRTG